MDAIRSAVQPITHGLPPQIRDVGISLLGGDCYRKLILDIDVTDTECIKLALSKGLGSGIVAVSAIVKLPQLYNLLQSQSAAGISFLSYVLETAAYVVTLAYNARMGNPFSTYGENAFIAAQNVAITSLVLHYTKKDAGAVAFIAVLAGAVYALFNKELVDLNTMSLFQAGAGVLGVASKLPQIFTIWSEGSTGQLSSFAVFNFLFGSLSRIFTTLQEVNDPLILYGYIAGFALNLVLALQVLYYWNSPAKTAVKKKSKAKKAAKTPKITAENEKGEPIPVSTSSSSQHKSATPSTRRRA